MPARGRMLVYRATSSQDGDLLADAAALGFARAEPTSATVAVPDEDSVVVATVPAAAVAIADALPVLLAGPGPQTPAWRRPADSLVAWSSAARLAVGLVARHQLVPTLVPTDDGQTHGVWRADPDHHAVSRVVADRLAAGLPVAGHALVRPDGRVWAPAALLRAFWDAVADLCARQGADEPGPARPRARLLPWTVRWADALRDPQDPRVPLREDRDEVLAAVAGWHSPAAAAGGRLTEARLDVPGVDDGPWRLTFGVRTESGELLPAARVWGGDAGAAGDGDAGLQETLMRGLGRCARVFPPLDRALGEAAPEGLDLDLGQAWRFVDEAAPLLEGSDVVVVLPEGLSEDAPRLRLRVGADADGAAADHGTEPDEHDADRGPQVRYRWEVALGDEVLAADEFERLMEDDRPLVRWRDRWVSVDPRLREHLGRLEDGTVGFHDSLVLALAGTAPVDGFLGGRPDGGGAAGGAGTVEVVAEGRVAGLLAGLAEAGERRDVPESPEGFTGRLRPYQRRGVAWLGAMAGLGLGAVLADDMGLGKTVQLIGHLLGGERRGPFLVVCPTSVVGNWEREIRRFAPGLAVTRFHGPDRTERLTEVVGVVLTTYGVIRRDPAPLTAVEWDVVALDEAQHVKNPATAGAKAVRRLSSRQTVVLTGTPLENRLTELWSLLDVTNPGLFGSRGRFSRRFVEPVERRRDPAAGARLRRVVAPFVLRREKHDPGVLTDLPDKIERTVVCSLTPEQERLYRAAVQRAFAGDLAEAQGIQRRGRILGLITALKQVCNHPAHYLGETGAGQAGGPPLTGRAGKLAVARQIVAEAVGADDQVLVFTQYVEMGRLLVAQLSADLGADVPFLHGGVSAVARDRMVAAFQGERGGHTPPVLIVSLRAGGTGLNLTAATHVVHYDRWWNPAVEDQATDRTHRIGQQRTVEVHKLVTAGTVEERIADLLERKRDLAERVVGAGEQWITELGDDELAELVSLSAPAEELDDDDPPPGGERLWNGYEEAS